MRSFFAVGVALATGIGFTGAGTAAASTDHAAHTPLRVKVIGTRADGSPKFTASSPTGLSPTTVQTVYGLTPSAGNGSGQTIAIVDAYHDPNALSDLNKFSLQYGLPQCNTANPCFAQLDPQGVPAVNSGWVLEESLDIEWAHAQAPSARILLVEAASASFTNLLAAVDTAVQNGANFVSMSWGGSEFSTETASDSHFNAPGVTFTASSGDNGYGVSYPAASPNVLAVGGTTLGGCSRTSCGTTVTETAWSGSGGGASAFEALPGYQSSYSGTVSGATTIGALTGGTRAVPDVSFEGNPNTGVSVYDSTRYQHQSGWFTLGGTSVGAPNWAGVLAAGRSNGATALQTATSIYGGGYSTNLVDVTSGSNGTCGTPCTAGPGYDLVTGLGSPRAYS
ncbi:MAG TPA: S53 family peptidase [Acidimicrobiales bacterium]|nr:S53 family peptidase [Acidimicrobiales bacterium]